jgi:hypothetical protein
MASKNYAVAACRSIEENPAITAGELRVKHGITAKSASVVTLLKKWKEAYEKSLETDYGCRVIGNKVVVGTGKLEEKHRLKFPQRCFQFEQLIELFGGNPEKGDRGAKPIDILNDF